jgi:hypothetical protein
VPVRLAEVPRHHPGSQESGRLTVTARVPSPTLRALLRRVVDYAGVFPPASLSIQDAVARYVAHLRSPDAWMLGRFVARVEQLDELARAALPLVAHEEEPWRLSAIAGTDLAGAGRLIRAFNASHRGRFLVDVVECPPIPKGAIARAVGVLPGELRAFVELPIVEDPRPMLMEIAAAGAWAKMRTGGVTTESIPATFQVARLIVRAAEVRIPFKATAGLHHPLRGEYALTYDDNAPRGRMFGFLNVFAAAVFAQQNMSEKRLTQLLEEVDSKAIVCGADQLRWRDCSATTKQIVNARSSLAVSFGSCSFSEPVEGLRAMGSL